MSNTTFLDSSWSELDEDAVRYARALAMDAVQKVGNGHPGTAMALAPVAYLLFQKVLRHDPSDPSWIARDRFILSCGHSSLTLYIQLFLGGFGLELEDLKEFRTWGSLTPGHPEFGHTKGVETTTGPLGQGLANGVGMAMASRFRRGLLDPNPQSGKSIFDQNIWVLASDGDLQEGVSAEASSLAGVQALGNLKVIYDDNRISIEGDTHLAFTEDVSARYRAYGWEVFDVDTLLSGDVDRAGLTTAIDKALAIFDRPVLIRLKSVIAWPAPQAKNTAKSHGSALGADEVAAAKKELGLDPTEFFAISDQVLNHTRSLISRGKRLRDGWNKDFSQWAKDNPERAELLDRLSAGLLPKTWDSDLPTFEPGKSVATRKASGDVIQSLAARLPELWGGSADLADSNNTPIHSSKSFLPVGSAMKSADPYGRNIHFGIREHAMGAIANGIALFGLSRIYVGTFLVFSDYMRGAVRLSALMNLPVTYIWSHDSIGLGEDGPTHQPIEHVAALRAIPNLAVIRPADANETLYAWRRLIQQPAPSALLLSRQNLPVLSGTDSEGVARGAYVLGDFFAEGSTSLQAILIATGSELHLALDAAKAMIAQGVSTRVVSAPSLEWFRQMPKQYQDSVLPPSIRARVSVEAAVAQGWHEWIGDAGVALSLEHFGASASAEVLFEKFGFTVERICSAIKESLVKVKAQ
ncbi:MAG: transketolase [Actinobacteria bacterium]|nr:transketolase [Actinomycetota bacterium]